VDFKGKGIARALRGGRASDEKVAPETCNEADQCDEVTGTNEEIKLRMIGSLLMVDSISRWSFTASHDAMLGYGVSPVYRCGASSHMSVS
jgi:hypothetical protein